MVSTPEAWKDNSQGLSERSERNPWCAESGSEGTLKGRQDFKKFAESWRPSGAPSVSGHRYQGLPSLRSVNPWLMSFHASGVTTDEVALPEARLLRAQRGSCLGRNRLRRPDHRRQRAPHRHDWLPRRTDSCHRRY